MSEILFDLQGDQAAPSAGQLLVFGLTGSKMLTTIDENDRELSIPGVTNFNTTDSVANAVNTYLAGSALAVPAHGLQAGTMFQWNMVVTKTGAGTVAPAWTIVVGTAGTTADTVRCTFTGPAQTAAVDVGIVQIIAILRNVGAAGVLAGGLKLVHNTAGTDLAAAAGLGGLITTPVLQNTSAGFDTTVANLIVGICVNPGTSGIWTHQIVVAEMRNI